MTPVFTLASDDVYVSNGMVPGISVAERAISQAYRPRLASDWHLGNDTSSARTAVGPLPCPRGTPSNIYRKIFQNDRNLFCQTATVYSIKCPKNLCPAHCGITPCVEPTKVGTISHDNTWHRARFGSKHIITYHPNVFYTCLSIIAPNDSF